MLVPVGGAGVGHLLDKFFIRRAAGRELLAKRCQQIIKRRTADRLLQQLRGVSGRVLAFGRGPLPEPGFKFRGNWND